MKNLPNAQNLVIMTRRTVSSAATTFVTLTGWHCRCVPSLPRRTPLSRRKNGLPAPAGWPSG